MTNQQAKGIWQYLDKTSDIEEGNTPLVKVENIYFKCEYENPSGSVKDRGIAYQVSKLKEKGVRETVISSSGNAAISAASYCQYAGINLVIFISPSINRQKLKRLTSLGFKIIVTKRPISQAIRYAKTKNAYNLRQSKDKNAQLGYQTLGLEIAEQLPSVEAIFFPVSSGATLIGTISGLKKQSKFPAIHAAQTESVCPIASAFDRGVGKTTSSIADGIVARFTPLKNQVIAIIRESQGHGWVIGDSKIEEAANWLRKHNLICSYEGALALAAYLKAKEAGYKYKKPLCILTGKFYE